MSIQTNDGREPGPWGHTAHGPRLTSQVAAPSQDETAGLKEFRVTSKLHKMRKS